MKSTKGNGLIKIIISICVVIVMAVLYFNFTGIFKDLSSERSIAALIFMILGLLIPFGIINFTDGLFKNMVMAYKVMMEVIAVAYFIVTNIITFLALSKSFYIFLAAQIILFLALVALTCAVEYFSKVCNEKIKKARG